MNRRALSIVINTRSAQPGYSDFPDSATGTIIDLREYKRSEPLASEIAQRGHLKTNCVTSYASRSMIQECCRSLLAGGDVDVKLMAKTLIEEYVVAV
ncbi:hypothetical protein P3T23_002609 [Paraburkholderia sp. GAS448]|uniref:hypothetical protein n=1 Tax=Paraburkholderia sp. GAS448 TaxID=3035136 RepID=UPI003D2195BB